MNKQLALRLKILIGLIVLFLLSNLYFFLVKIGGAVFLVEGLIQLTLFICLIVWTITLIWRITRNSEWRRPANFLTVSAIPMVIIISGFDSLTADENTFQSDVKIRACYEGLYFRENGEFEDFNIGFFAHVNYVSGTWKMDGDTIMLKITSGKHNLLKGRMIIKDNFLYAIEKDSIKPTFYYLGECKNLN